MILSPVNWPQMAVAYLVGGRTKQAVYRSLYYDSDVDETLGSSEWKAFISAITRDIDDEIETGAGTPGKTGAGTPAPSIKSITKAALAAMRLQVIGEISARLADTAMDPKIRASLIQTAQAMVEEKGQAINLDSSNGVSIYIAPRQTLNEATGKETPGNRTIDITPKRDTLNTLTVRKSREAAP